MEVSKANFAKLACVSRAAITEKAKRNTLVINSAGKLDSENPTNAAYIAEHRRKFQEKIRFKNAADPGAGTNTVPGPDAVSFTAPPPAITPSFQENSLVNGNDFSLSVADRAGVPDSFLSLTIRELVLKHGDVTGVERWSKILLNISGVQEKNQRTAERRLDHVEKNFVMVNLFGFLDDLLNQLLDWPDSAVDHIISLVESLGRGARIRVVGDMRDGLALVIAGAKERIIGRINELRSEYQKKDEKNAIDDIYDKLDQLEVVA